MNKTHTQSYGKTDEDKAFPPEKQTDSSVI